VNQKRVYCVGNARKMLNLLQFVPYWHAFAFKILLVDALWALRRLGNVKKFHKKPAKLASIWLFLYNQMVF
jgi:hypothetical protein